MKDKKKIAIGILVILVMTSVGILIGYNLPSAKSVESVNNNKDQSVDLGDENVDIPEKIDEKELNAIIEYMNSFDSVAFVKSSSANIFEGNDHAFSREQYIVSEVDLVKGTDETIDRMTGSETFEQKLNFKDVFGIDAKDYYEPFSLMKDVLKEQGINTDFLKASLDVEMYEITGQKTYRLENDSEIIQKMIENLDYDEILDSYCYFTVTDTTSGESYIQFIGAKVEYRKGNTATSKNLTLVTEVYNQDGTNTPEPK